MFQHSDIEIVWYGLILASFVYWSSLMPDVGTVLLQNIHAEKKLIIFIALSGYLNTPANFPIVIIDDNVIRISEHRS